MTVAAIIVGACALYALALWLGIRTLGAIHDDEDDSQASAATMPRSCRSCRHWRPVSHTTGRCPVHNATTFASRSCEEHSPW